MSPPEETLTMNMYSNGNDSTSLRLLIAINVRWWNAEAAYALNVARSFASKGVPVWLLADENSPVFAEALKAAIPVVRGIHLSSHSPVVQWQNYHRLRQFVTDHRINVINSFKSHGAFLFTLLRNRLPGIVYCKTRGEAKPPKNNVFNRYLYGPKGCDGVIVSGEKVKTWVTNLAIGQQQITTIYYGDSPLITRASASAQQIVYDELSLPMGHKIIALIGRTQKVKGHSVALEALKDIAQQPVHLLFLVKDMNEYPEELKSMKQFIAENNLSDRVTIIGFVKDLPQVLRKVDFGIIPSLDSEINCRVVVELFSMGIPVVAFPTGTLPEVIDHKKNGYICANRTVNGLRQGIEWMLHASANFPELQKNALKSYQENYSLDKLYKSSFSFFERLLSSRRN